MAGETQKDVSMWTVMSYGDPAREWFAESLGVPWPADESLPAPTQPSQSLEANAYSESKSRGTVDAKMTRLPTLGNAVVPVCAEVIGHIIQELASDGTKGRDEENI